MRVAHAAGSLARVGVPVLGGAPGAPGAPGGHGAPGRVGVLDLVVPAQDPEDLHFPPAPSDSSLLRFFDRSVIPQDRRPQAVVDDCAVAAVVDHAAQRNGDQDDDAEREPRNTSR